MPSGEIRATRHTRVAKRVSALPAEPRVSAVVITRNEGRRLRETVECLDATLPSNSDIVVVDDGSHDGSTAFLKRRRSRRTRLLSVEAYGVARARNLGARRSQGDVVVFCDAHIQLQDDWWKPLCDLLRHPKTGAAAPIINAADSRRSFGCGLTFKSPDLEVKWLPWKTREPVQAPILPGCTLAMRRDVFEAIDGHDEALLASGCVDNEICLRLWLCGYQLWVSPDTVVTHHFRLRPSYPWPSRLLVHNRLRTALVHFSPHRLERTVGALRDYHEFGEALLMVAAGDVAARRKQIFAERTKNDDWFCKRFSILL